MNGRNATVTDDEQWEGLAEVVPLRGRDAWPTWPPEGRTEPGGAHEETRQLVVLRVQCFADAREVAEYLMAYVPVLLDLSATDPDVAKRVLDFSSGVVFGLDCAMHRVDRNVFLLAPEGTEVAGQGRGAI
ncbi:cell division protein SepF [Streptomyces sp. URMC 123]|uniref:cell division protein SepF n=1 Tax=Streptomyces sp. URMC 123 TaxID=3423403 RepID=UPI003F1BDF52